MVFVDDWRCSIQRHHGQSNTLCAQSVAQAEDIMSENNYDSLCDTSERRPTALTTIPEEREDGPRASNADRGQTQGCSDMNHRLGAGRAMSKGHVGMLPARVAEYGCTKSSNFFRGHDVLLQAHEVDEPSRYSSKLAECYDNNNIANLHERRNASA